MIRPKATRIARAVGFRMLRRTARTTLFLLVLGARMVCAQQERTHGVSVDVLGGTWSIGEGAWPFILAGAEYRVSPRVALGLSVGGVSRPVNLCSSGVDDPICDARKVIRMVTAEARFDLRARGIRPYVAVSSGRTWYFHSGTEVALLGGLAIPVNARISARGEAALRFIGESGEAAGATSLQIGAAFRL